MASEQDLIDDEARRFGKYLQTTIGESGPRLAFTVCGESGQRYQFCLSIDSGMDDREATEFRQNFHAAIHQLVNNEINLQADKIEALYRLAMPRGECGGTQHQLIVLRSWIRKMSAILRHLESTGDDATIAIGDMAANNPTPPASEARQ